MGRGFKKRFVASSREDAWIETVEKTGTSGKVDVASSREDAWIETAERIEYGFTFVSRPPARTRGLKLITKLTFKQRLVASSREDAWIETMRGDLLRDIAGRVLPRGRVD